MNKKWLLIGGCIIMLLIGVTLVIVGMTNSNNTPETVEINSSPNDNEPSTATSSDPQNNTNQEPASENRSTSELNTAILQQNPSLTQEGRVIFDIVDTKKVDENWYVVKVSNTAEPTAGINWIILKDEGGTTGLVVVAGPGSYFPDSIPIPDSVRKAIR